MPADDQISVCETVVIYESEGQWIAHGLKTDQIGVGARILEALADYLRAVDQVLELAASDDTIAYLSEAPADIQAFVVDADPLPQEMYEVAHKMARGEWPEDWEPPTPKTNAKAKHFKAEQVDNACA